MIFLDLPLDLLLHITFMMKAKTFLNFSRCSRYAYQCGCLTTESKRCEFKQRCNVWFVYTLSGVGIFDVYTQCSNSNTLSALLKKIKIRPSGVTCSLYHSNEKLILSDNIGYITQKLPKGCQMMIRIEFSR